MLDVLWGEFIVVGNLHALTAGINEERSVILLALLQYHNAGSDRGAKEEVIGELDDAIYIVVVNQILAYLLLRTATIHNARETNYARRAVGCQPRQRVHNERQVCLALWSKHAGRSIARVVDKSNIIVALPLDRIRRVRNNHLKWFIVPMLWREKCILAGDIKLVVVNVVQEHIDTAEVVGGKVNLLTIETLTHIVLAEYLCRFEQQRTRTASRVIDLIDFGLSESCQTGEELAHLLWGVILAAALACIARIHTHQVFVGITESIYRIVLVVAKVHLLNATKEFHQFLVSLDDGRSQLI